jgi:hypothetical protein
MGWNLNSLFSKLNYLTGPMQGTIPLPNNSTNRLGNMFRKPLAQKPIKLKASKVYDKFDFDDLEEMQVEFRDNSNQKDPSTEKQPQSPHHHDSSKIEIKQTEVELSDEKAKSPQLQENAGSFMTLLRANDIRKT